MAITFKPLWKLLIDKDMTKKQLMEFTGISKSTVNKMKHDNYVALDVIDRICDCFNCDIDAVMIHIPVNSKENDNNG